MASNPYVNKVVKADGTTIIDISDTTAVASDVASGKYFYTSDGAKVQGTSSGGGTAAISVVDTADPNGGTVRTITALDISDTTAIASDVAQGKYFYTADGTKTQGTASGGGSPSATQHEIHLEFSDSTDTDIDVYYDDALLGAMITAYKPTTYDSKTVTLAQLDGVTWYEPASIPIGVELIDFTAVKNDYIINASGQEEYYQWTSVSDYTLIDPSMTFTYKGYQWFYIGFYDASKNPISTIYIDSDKDSHTGEIATGTLNPIKIPANAKYVRIDSLYNPDSSELSLIRTA